MSDGLAEGYEYPRYFNVGMTVWVPYRSAEHPRRALKCTVTVAAGDHARAASCNPEKYPFDGWVSRWDAIVKTAAK